MTDGEQDILIWLPTRIVGKVLGFVSTSIGQFVILMLFYWIFLPLVLLALIPLTCCLPEPVNHVWFDGGFYYSDGKGHRCLDAYEPRCTIKDTGH